MMLSRRPFSILMVITAMLLSSCGNKGALVLPPKAPDGSSSQAKSS
ncbi:MAG: LPS translocon maturation chaperone LptM [Rhodocyclaceae bacterium]